jgi:hypothetical protein
MIPSVSNDALLGELLRLNDALTDKLQAVVSRKDFPQLARKPSRLAAIDTGLASAAGPVVANITAGSASASTPASSGADSYFTLGGDTLVETSEPEEDEDLVALLSPRIDKGKGRAEPEPIAEPAEHPPVTAPVHGGAGVEGAFAIGDEDEDGEDGEEGQAARPRVLTMGGMNAVDDPEVRRVVEGMGAPSPTER